jgi:hypothetical protein
MSTDENRQKVVKFVQELLLDEDDKSAITPALIAAEIDMVIAMKPSWGHGLDRVKVTTELIRRFSLWIGDDTALTSGSGHEAWLSAARKRDWRYWQQFKLPRRQFVSCDIRRDKFLRDALDLAT